MRPRRVPFVLLLLLTLSSTTAADPYGPEIPLDTYSSSTTPAYSQNVTLDMDVTGRFSVAYERVFYDSVGDYLYTRVVYSRFDEDGTALVTESEWGQEVFTGHHPNAICRSDGAGAVVWRRPSQGLRAKFFDTDGNQLDNVFLTALAVGQVLISDAAMDDMGNFAVLTAAADTDNITLRTFDSSGNALAGLVVVGPGWFQSSITMHRDDGDLVVCSTSDTAYFFALDGSTRAPSIPLDKCSPLVTNASRQLAYLQFDDAGSPETSDDTISLVRLDDVGNQQSATVLVTGDVDNMAQLVLDDDGSVVVQYEQAANAWLQIFDASDTPVDAPLPLPEVADTVVGQGSDWFVEATWSTARIYQSVPTALPRELPQPVSISSIAPNPFNPRTVIHYNVDAPAWGSLVVFDVSGRRVRTLAQGRFYAGHATTQWDGRDQFGLPVASGVYLVRLEVPGSISAGRMTLLR